MFHSFSWEPCSWDSAGLCRLRGQHRRPERRDAERLDDARVVVAFDGELSFPNGLVLFFCLLIFLGYCVLTARSPSLPEDGEIAQVLSQSSTRRGKEVFLVVVGMAGLAVGAELTDSDLAAVIEEITEDTVVQDLEDNLPAED